MIKNCLAIVGAFIVILAIAGSLGIGNMRIYYGGDPMGCTKMESENLKENL